MKRLLLLSLTALLFSGCSDAPAETESAASLASAQAAAPAPPVALILDLKKIALKNPAEIEATLGTPRGCENNKYGMKCTYNRADTEIVFINDQADWITIKDRAVGEVPWSERALEAFGLTAADPAFRSTNVGQTDETLRWVEEQGFKEIALFRNQFLYVKTRTP